MNTSPYTFTHTFTHTLRTLLTGAALVALTGAIGKASAAPVQTFGAGSALGYVQFAAEFEGNTSAAAVYNEGGLTFTDTSASSNGGCGYAYTDCGGSDGSEFSAAFTGNYFAALGSGASVRISSGSTVDLQAIEFAFDSGYLFGNIHGFWQTWRDGSLTGSGRFELGAVGTGGVVGLSDSAGFDEVRLYAFNSATGTTSSFSAPAIDNVYAAPTPASAWLAAAGLALLWQQRRRTGYTGTGGGQST